MDLEHSFTIPVPPERAWGVLLDVERVAPCMPGATIDAVDGDEIKGRIKVKVGPVALTYAGSARFTEKDETTRTVVLKASGKETRGSGTAAATINSSLRDEDGQTRVVVRTSMTVTGRPAQFGRGVIAEVGGRIIEKFASNLATQLSGGATAARQPAATPGPEAAAVTSNGVVSQAEAGLGQPIEELNLPVRTYNSLRREGVHTVGSLAARSEKDLLAIDGLGPQSVKEIQSKLAARGLSLSPGETAAARDAAGAAQPATGTAAAGATAGAASTPAAAPSAAPAGAATSDFAAGSAAPAAADYDDLASANGTGPRLDARPPDEDALDLLSVAGLPVLKRALPVLGFAVILAVLFGLLGRRRRSARG